MKIYQALLIALCITFALACDNKDASKEKCNKDLTDAEKELGFTHCCYVRYKAEKREEAKGCEAMNQYQFDHLMDYIKQRKYSAGTDDYNIECSSTYFKLSFLSLILILL